MEIKLCAPCTINTLECAIAGPDSEDVQPINLGDTITLVSEHDCELECAVEATPR